MILQVKEIKKTFSYSEGKQSIDVLKGVNLEVNEGDTVAILGQSGSGKSTLLSILAGCLDTPTSGSILLQNQSMETMGEKELARFRAQHIGIVFQQFHLMSHLTAMENVSLPLELTYQSQADEKATQALQQVGLGHRLHHFPWQLSGGESQRVAIARALVVQPALMLADEPTGNLDQETGDQVANLLFDLVSAKQMTLLLVTHDHQLAQRCQKRYTLQDGTLHDMA